MTTTLRTFPRICVHCGTNNVYPAITSNTFEVLYNGVLHNVFLKDFDCEKCGYCGGITVDDGLDSVIDAALQEQLGKLTI